MRKALVGEREKSRYSVFTPLDLLPWVLGKRVFCLIFSSASSILSEKFKPAGEAADTLPSTLLRLIQFSAKDVVEWMFRQIM